MYKTFVLLPYEKIGNHTDNNEFGIQVNIMYICGLNWSFGGKEKLKK